MKRLFNKKDKVVKIDYDTIYEFNGVLYKMSRCTLTEEYGCARILELILSDVSKMLDKVVK